MRFPLQSIGCIEDSEITFQLWFDFRTSTVDIKLFVLPVTATLLAPDTVDGDLRELNHTEEDCERVE